MFDSVAEKLPYTNPEKDWERLSKNQLFEWQDCGQANKEYI